MMEHPQRAASGRRNPRSKEAAGGEYEVVRIWLLGGFRVSVGERSIGEGRWRLRKARHLVKLLAFTPEHRLHREQIIYRLWPDLDQAMAANSLRQALHVARRALGPGASRYLSLQGELVALCPDSPLWVDADAFLDAAAAARRARDPAAYRTATELYSGDLLPGDLYEGWTELRREELRRVYLTLLEELADLYEEREDFGPAIEALGRVVTTEPGHEAAHASLMRIYALSGQRGEALRQYGRLLEVLSAEEEFDAEPGSETRRLYEEISTGRFPPARSPPTSAPREEPAPSPHNLPVARTSFVGREREVVEVKRLLAMTGLLSLTGPGGSGKTRLAVELARDLIGSYPDGVWLVELAPLSDPALVPGTVAGVLGVREQPNRPPIDTLAEALKARKMLLVLDNCEHLIDACARLMDVLLGSCPGVRVLATSREPLNVAGEVVWPVPSLSVPDAERPLTVAGLKSYESARLFVERALYRPSAFVLTAEIANTVAEICQQLDGIPLAIELAAARVGALAVGQISERLGDSLKLLTGGDRTATPRQQTLRGTLDWSYDLLSEPEKELFRWLSAFAGGWTLEAAEAVGAGEGVEEEGRVSNPPVLDLLSRLVDKSLVVAEAAGGSSRYRMLEPVRQYAREKLEESGEAEKVHRRHAEHYLALAGQAERELYGSDRTRWLDLLETEHDNIRAALVWSLDGGDEELGLRLVSRLWLFWSTRGYLDEGRGWLEKGVTGSSAKLLKARALEGASFIAFFQTEYDLCRALAEEGVLLYRELGDDDGVASCLTNISGAAIMGMQDLEPARALHQEAWKLRPRLRDPRTIAKMLIVSALFSLLEGDLEGASVKLHEEALAMYRDVGDVQGMGMCLSDLGWMALIRGDFDEATKILRDNLRLSGPANDMQGIQNGLLGLAGVAASLEQPDRAARLWGAAKAVREATGIRLAPLTMSAMNYEGGIAAVRDRLGEERFVLAWTEGEAMPPAAAIEYALSGEEPAPAAPPSATPDRIPEAPSTVRRDVLTPRQKEISALVARGFTNRRIASELTISERTVETHIGRILKKLGLSSRTQLATWVIQRWPPPRNPS